MSLLECRPASHANGSRLASRAVHIALLASWIALVVWKVQVFLSEPTGTEVRFVSQMVMPRITVCSYFGVRMKTSYATPAVDRVPPSVSENDTLISALGKESSTILGMLPEAREKTDYRADPLHLNYTSRYGLWTSHFNFLNGGACGTLEPSGVSPVILLHRVLFKRSFGDSMYRLHVHRLADFWGAEDIELVSLAGAEMKSVDILGVSPEQEFVIDVEREIIPNLRRRPCAEDPAYSRSTCWRNCFFDSLNCSMVNDPTGKSDGKPACRAGILLWYIKTYRVFAGEKEYDIGYSGSKQQCSCPRPCVLDRYVILPRASPDYSTREVIHLPLSFKPVVRVLETSVTYDIVDLLAETGGFLGLLLGYSVLSMFDDVKTLASRAQRRFIGPITPTDVDEPLDPDMTEKKSAGRSIRVKSIMQCSALG